MTAERQLAYADIDNRGAILKVSVNVERDQYRMQLVKTRQATSLTATEAATTKTRRNDDTETVVKILRSVPVCVEIMAW
jgi:hypothetical protein